MSQFKFLVSSHVEFKYYVKTWVIEFCQNLSLEFHPKFFWSLFFSSQRYFNTIFFLLFPFSFFTSYFVHNKTPWPMCPHSGQYPPGSLEPFSSPGWPSAVLIRVCWLERSAVCSAFPALVDDMIGSNIFYCILHTCDSV